MAAKAKSQTYVPESQAARVLQDELMDSIYIAPKEDVEDANAEHLSPSTSLADHMRVIFGLEPAAHHMEWIEALEDESIKRLLIVTPPGHAKTTVVSVAYPSWKLANNTNRHFLYMGNTADQASKQSVAIRDLMVSPKFTLTYPHVSRSRTKPWGASMWYLDRENAWDKDPSFLALGVDGPALGARADEVLFDDVCDLENMATALQREKVQNKVKAVAFSRQSGSSKNTRMIAVMTRWHADDLAGFFEKEGFHIIWMPALGYWDMVKPYMLAGGTIKLDELHRLPFAKDLDNGAALWPEEYPAEFFDAFKSSPDIWQLEYQGMTTASSGNIFNEDIFKGWSNDAEAHPEAKRLENPHHARAILQFWDTASKLANKNDYSVCETWAVMPDGYYLIHCWRGRVEFPQLVTRVKQMWLNPPVLMDGDNPVQIRPRAVYVEDSSNGVGTALIQTLRTDQRGRVPITGLPANESKEERAEKASNWLQDAPFYFPLDRTAYSGLSPEDFLDEHLAFPRGHHDDVVDVTSYAAERLHLYRVDGSGATSALLSENRIMRERTQGRASLAFTGARAASRIQRGRFGAAGRGRRFSA